MDVSSAYLFALMGAIVPVGMAACVSEFLMTSLHLEDADSKATPIFYSTSAGGRNSARQKANFCFKPMSSKIQVK